MTGGPDRSESGAATLVVLSVAGVLLMLGAALGVVEAMVVAHRQAQAAADLTALAGAAAAAQGSDGCAAAAAIAEANDAELLACVSDGMVVTVQVQVEGPHWLGQSADLMAEARAGPAAEGMAAQP